MINKISITILVDNKSSNPGLLSEHGLALWIEADGKRILFDAGQSDILLRNAGYLKIDLKTAGLLVISHGHYDHTGSVAEILNLNRSIQVYCHPGIFVPRYSRQDDGTLKPIGMEEKHSGALQEIIDSIKWISKPMNLSEDIGITGRIPRIKEFEDTGGSFFLDPDGTRQDSIPDDLAMWFKTKKGLVIVTGCCHSGLINTIEYIIKITGEEKIHSIIGGFHLKNASTDRLERTCRALESFSPCKLIACHCTGDNAVDFLSRHIDSSVVNGESGMIFEVN